MDLETEIINGNIQNVKELLAHGANVEAHNDKGWSPLIIAIQNARFEIVKLLLEAGANPNPPDEKLAQTGLPLNLAADMGNVKILKLLLSHGANINTTDIEGTSPLHFAVSSLKMTKILIEQGANINKCDQDGYTPFTSAIEDGNIKIVKYLVENGANVNFRNGNSWTPLIKAIQSDHFEIAKYLIQQGADVDLIDNQGLTPLSTAIEDMSDLEFVRLLVENGADVHDLQTVWLPISYAIHYDKPEIVKFLMDNGANLNYRDMDGKKAIEVALDKDVDDIDMFKMLVI